MIATVTVDGKTVWSGDAADIPTEYVKRKERAQLLRHKLMQYYRGKTHIIVITH